MFTRNTFFVIIFIISLLKFNLVYSQLTIDTLDDHSIFKFYKNVNKICANNISKKDTTLIISSIGKFPIYKSDFIPIKVKLVLHDGIVSQALIVDQSNMANIYDARLNDLGLNGPLKKYYDNNQLESLFYYKNGVLTGPFLEYYESGQIRSFTSNDRYFFKIEYYENGIVNFWQQQYFNPKDSTDLEGFFDETYYTNGQVGSTTIFNAGIQKFNMYYPNGNLLMDGFILNNELLKVGKWLIYNEDGTRDEINYELTEDQEKANIKSGPTRKYDKNNKLILEEFYENDILIKKTIIQKE